MPTIDLHSVMPWLLRAVPLVCALAAGWSFGRSVPDWKGDAATDHFDLDILGDDRLGYGGRGGWGWGWGGWGWGFGGLHGYPYHPGGCLRLEACGCFGCLGALGQIFHGGLAGVLCLLGAVVVSYYAWPWEALARDRHSWAAALLGTPGLWIVVVGVIGGWVLAVTTDKGPVGPLE